MNLKTMDGGNGVSLDRELYLYHCAGGHTRAWMAQVALEKAGFKFKRNPGDGPMTLIFWPDGVRLTYKDGEVVYREWEPVAKCQGFKRVASGWAPEKLSGKRRGQERLRRTYRKDPCENKATSSGFCRHHAPKDVEATLTDLHTEESRIAKEAC